MTDSSDAKSFFRGLLAAVLVVVFTQTWFWYDQNRSSEKAIYDVKTEIRENGLLLGFLKEGVSTKDALSEADGLRVKRILDKLSRAAYERSRASFDKSSHNFYNGISDYYTHLGELQSRADDIYEQTEYLLRQGEKFEKERDAQVQQLTNLVLGAPRSEKTAPIFRLLKKRTDLMSKAAADTQSFLLKSSQTGLQLLLSELKVAELAGESADASTDGLLAENHMSRVLLVGFLFLMPLLILLAIVPSSASRTTGMTGKSSNNSTEAGSEGAVPS
jgi:hypothetical protein